MPRSSLAVLALAVLAGCTPARVPATDACTGCVGWSSVFLSGGRDAEQNAVAHEKNLLFAGRTLERHRVPLDALFFADGADPGLDVQQEEPTATRRRLLMASALLVEPEADLHAATLQYRDHVLPGARPADLATVLAGLQRNAAAARPESPDLMLYVTDHGTRAQDESNNVIVLWGEDDLSVRQLGTALDAQPPSRRVVTVMAQCFSGSFAALVHQGGDPALPLAPHDRCGFFAAPSDRPAAGCSPRSDESLYDDYTTRFFGALGGLDRQGQPTADADADRDGRVSFEEAHFAAIALEQTQDVPVCTSEELLRRSRPAWLATFNEDIGFDRLLPAARPALRRAVEALLRATSLPATASIQTLHTKLEVARARCWPGLCEAEERLMPAQRRAHELLVQAAGKTDFSRMFPARTLLSVGTGTMQSWVDRAQPAFDEALRLDQEIERRRAESETHEGRLLRLERLHQWMQLAARAQREGGALWASYERVLRCEADGPWLHPPRAQAAPSAR